MTTSNDRSTVTKLKVGGAGVVIITFVLLSVFGSKGRPAEIVPDVKGLTASEAIAKLESQDIEYPDYGTFFYPYDVQPLQGTTPRAGSEVRAPWSIEDLLFEPIVVTKVLDARTVEISTGDIVRFIGVSVPAPGDCGAAEAVQLIESEVLGKEVDITNPPEVVDRDEANRLLAHVSSERIWSLGQLLLLEGLGTASNEGYETHPQQELFEEFSSEKPKFSCEPPAATQSPKIFDHKLGRSWQCSYVPSMDYDFYNDVICRNGEEVVHPRLREWDDYVTESEMRQSMREYENQLNGS